MVLTVCFPPLQLRAEVREEVALQALALAVLVAARMQPKLARALHLHQGKETLAVQELQIQAGLAVAVVVLDKSEETLMLVPRATVATAATEQHQQLAEHQQRVLAVVGVELTALAARRALVALAVVVLAATVAEAETEDLAL